MKKFFILILVITSFSFVGFSQSLNNQLLDKEIDQKVLIGKCDRKGITRVHKEFKLFYNFNYGNYKPDLEMSRKIHDEIQDKNFKIVVVVGTWCDDSKRWVPRFYKLMDEVGIKDDVIELIAVDSKKLAYTVDVAAYDIEKVPTFIVYDEEGKEKGRIIESPEDSIEKDFYKIIKKL